ncbi:prepilin peptidase [Brumicola nitratireducens]|uniref:Prepilin leader peptidase/N-methyltransferase n=1 Tax=Glaciecola nitratireducens (strain JCM 12485 / KCTC 12276 / FR1064) TaxID=1085623 RepID=G4QMC4_GLANF|nr:A24 family peptidase [Glaciecola nitratireducens]AEP30776.1 prepilin peptidase [Glaciecola nitratireducens FR1064]
MENIALFELLAASPLAFVITTFCISLLVGSFLNVVIYRLPIMMEREWQRDIEQFQNPDKELPPAPTFNLVKPDSTCPNCQHKIRAWENIPVISWLMLGRKCSGCANPISARYPAVELLTAVMSAVVAYQLGFGLTGAAFILGTWLLVAMTFIDLDKMLLPDSLTLLLLWIGLGISCFESTISPIDSIIGAIIGYLILWSIYWAFKLLTGKEGMGYGDFKLLAALGAWVGWQHLPIIILLSSVVGAVVGITLMFIKKKDSDLAIPFGPYLAAAGWLTMLYGDLIADWYLSTL